MNRKIINIGILLSTLLFVSLNTFGQEVRSKHFGISVLPKINKPIFEDSNLGSGKNTNAVDIQFDFFYDYRSRIQFTSGLSLKSLSTSSIDYSAVLPCDVSPNGVEVLNSWYEDRLNIKYLGIPLGVKLKLIGSENHFYSRIGAELLLKVNHTSDSYLIECGINELELEDNIVNTPSNTVITGNFGIGYEMQLSQKLKFYLEPVIGYTITSIYNEAGIIGDLTNNLYILDYGMRIGIRY